MTAGVVQPKLIEAMRTHVERNARDFAAARDGDFAADVVVELTVRARVTNAATLLGPGRRPMLGS